MAERIELKAGLGRLRNGLVVGAVSVSIGIWVLIFADEAIQQRELTAAILIAVGLAFTGWTYVKIRHGGPLMVISDEGLWFRDWGDVTVPWRFVDKVYARGGRLRRFICVEVNDREKLLSALPANESEKLRRGGPFVKLPVLLIPYGSVEGAPEDLAEALERHLDKP
jgi:hypothetical protein